MSKTIKIQRTALFIKCLDEARVNENLMPIDCFNIVQKKYGRRLYNIKKEVLVQMIHEMMLTVTDYDYREYINEMIYQ